MPRKAPSYRNRLRTRFVWFAARRSCSTPNWRRSMASKSGFSIKQSSGTRHVSPEISSFSSQPKKAKF